MDFFSMENLIKGGKVFLLLLLLSFMAAVAYGTGAYIGTFFPMLNWVTMILSFIFELLLLGWGFTAFKKWLR